MSRITVEKSKNTMLAEESEKMLGKLDWKSEIAFEDKALDQFVRNSDTSDLSVEPNYKISYLPIIILFLIMGVASFVGGILGSMEAYVAFPIAVLCLIGIIVSCKTV